MDHREDHDAVGLVDEAHHIGKTTERQLANVVDDDGCCAGSRSMAKKATRTARKNSLPSARVRS